MDSLSRKRVHQERRFKLSEALLSLRVGVPTIVNLSCMLQLSVFRFRWKKWANGKARKECLACLHTMWIESNVHWWLVLGFKKSLIQHFHNSFVLTLTRAETKKPQSIFQIYYPPLRIVWNRLKSLGPESFLAFHMIGHCYSQLAYRGKRWSSIFIEYSLIIWGLASITHRFCRCAHHQGFIACHSTTRS